MASTPPHPGPARLRPGLGLWATATPLSRQASREHGSGRERGRGQARRALLPLPDLSELHNGLPASGPSRAAPSSPDILRGAPQKDRGEGPGGEGRNTDPGCHLSLDTQPQRSLGKNLGEHPVPPRRALPLKGIHSPHHHADGTLRQRAGCLQRGGSTKRGLGGKGEVGDLGRPGSPPLPKPSLSLTAVYQSGLCGRGLGGVRAAGGPNGDAAVGDPRAVPAGPVVSVHASVLKPDVADAGWVVGECV